MSAPRAVPAAPGLCFLVCVIVAPRSAEFLNGGGGDVESPAEAAVFETAARQPHSERVWAATQCGGCLSKRQPSSRFQVFGEHARLKLGSDALVDELLKRSNYVGGKQRPQTLEWRRVADGTVGLGLL